MKYVYLIHFTKGNGFAMEHEIASSRECASKILKTLRELGYKAYYERKEVITKAMI